MDRARGVQYAAFTLSGCVVEVFGDLGTIVTNNTEVADLVVTEEMELLELRGRGAMRAGSVAALGSTADRNISQQWSCYLYEHWRVYGAVDGIIYTNAHNGEDAIMLYQRAKGKLILGPVGSMRLDDPGLQPYLLKIAKDHGLDPP